MTHSSNDDNRLLQMWRQFLLPAGVQGDGARWGIISTWGHDVGEGDHVVLWVSTSLLPADGATRLRGPVLHTNTQYLYTLVQLVCQLFEKNRPRLQINMQFFFKTLFWSRSVLFFSWIKNHKKNWKRKKEHINIWATFLIHFHMLGGTKSFQTSFGVDSCLTYDAKTIVCF